MRFLLTARKKTIEYTKYEQEKGDEEGEGGGWEKITG